MTHSAHRRPQQTIASVIAMVTIGAAGCAWAPVSATDRDAISNQIAAMIRICGSGSPGAERDSELTPHLRRLIRLARRNSGRMYDTDPKNDRSVEDSTTVDTQLAEMQGILAGVENPDIGICSRALARRAQAALDEIEG